MINKKYLTYTGLGLALMVAGYTLGAYHASNSVTTKTLAVVQNPLKKDDFLEKQQKNNSDTSKTSANANNSAKSNANNDSNKDDAQKESANKQAPADNSSAKAPAYYKTGILGKTKLQKQIASFLIANHYLNFKQSDLANIERIIVKKHLSISKACQEYYNL